LKPYVFDSLTGLDEPSTVAGTVTQFWLISLAPDLYTCRLAGITGVSNVCTSLHGDPDLRVRLPALSCRLQVVPAAYRMTPVLIYLATQAASKQAQKLLHLARDTEPQT